MLIKLFQIFVSSANNNLRSLCKRTMATNRQSNRVKLQVKQGVIVGQKHRLPNGKSFRQFLGVPYAVPPLGELRFKSPLPLDHFELPELDCTCDGNVSHQRDPFLQEIVGSENCLFLNIFAPETDSQHPLPVMVWIHGGGFFFGNGNSEYHYPQSLIAEDVIVVTLNYRLGALGFLCLPEAEIWGNAGLKDQRLALQWIQENITQFNGDPTNVTLFGESAGAASVHLHAYAEHAHKLFHKAILQSGSANMEWVFQANPNYRARRMAELLGCKSNNAVDILKYLQSPKVTPVHLLAQTISVLTPDERRRGLPLAYKPVVEDAYSPDIFIDNLIMDKLQKKDILAMPIIMGYNTGEGIPFLVNAIRKLQQIDEDLARFVPRNLPLAPEDKEVQEIARQMRNFYVQGRKLSHESLDKLTELLADYHFTYDFQMAAELQCRHQPHAPLFFYCFDYVGDRNMYKRMFQFEHLRGACHGDELFYLFQMAGQSKMQLSECDALMVKRLSRLWANFARFGQPTPNGVETPIIDCEWTPVQRPSGDADEFVLNYLVINKNCEMKQNLEKERMEFWRNIYATYKPTMDYSKLSAKL